MSHLNVAPLVGAVIIAIVIIVIVIFMLRNRR
jgi:hypothetical protein